MEHNNVPEIDPYGYMLLIFVEKRNTIQKGKKKDIFSSNSGAIEHSTAF